MLGVLLGYLLMELIHPVMVASFDLPRGSVPILLAAAVYYSYVAAVVVGGAVLAVRVLMRNAVEIRRTARAMSVLLPLAGIAVIPPTMGFAWATSYSTSVPVVLAEIAFISAVLGGTTMLARWWTLRDSQRPAPGAQAVDPSPGRLRVGG